MLIFDMKLVFTMRVNYAFRFINYDTTFLRIQPQMSLSESNFKDSNMENLDVRTQMVKFLVCQRQLIGYLGVL
jgi:hypothetical protein